MIELSMIFVAGLLGSSHCLGMCGGFAITIGTASPALTSNLYRQLVYSLGRIITYGFLGAVAGFGGHRLAHFISPALHAQAWLAMLAGTFLLYQGLKATGLLRARVFRGNSSCLASGVLATFLQSPRFDQVFLAGLFTGFLPCGLVYAFLSMAVATGHPIWGFTTMVCFGAGTVPLMVLAGCGGSLLSLATRKRMLQAAAWCVVGTGMLSVARGAYSLQISDGAAPACPFCEVD